MLEYMVCTVPQADTLICLFEFYQEKDPAEWYAVASFPLFFRKNIGNGPYVQKLYYPKYVTVEINYLWRN